jgi:spermidine synthase
MIRFSVYLFFLFSGASGLIFEVVWTRLLTTILGNTIYAVSIVLSVFMGGLALGSFLAGRIIDNRKDPLRVYALLEIGVGISGFCLTLLLNQTGLLYVWMYHLLGSNAFLLSFARYLFAFILIGVPTTLMGATLPVLSRFSVNRKSIAGSAVGLLYGVNTLGAAAGCFISGFVLIGKTGIVSTTAIAAAVNIAVGIAAWLLRNARLTDAENQFSVPAESPLRDAVTSSQGLAVVGAFAVSGFASMGYEITWMRLLVSYMGNSVYAFCAMTTSFLSGMALGSMVLSLFVDRLKRPFAWFGIFQAFIGFYTLVLFYFFAGHLMVFIPFTNPFPQATNAFALFVKAFGLMLLPTFFMGASFPVAGRLSMSALPAVGRKISVLYSWNTVACIAGSMVAGFIMVPLLGFEKSLTLLCVLNIVAAFFLFITEPAMRRRLKTFAALGLAAVSVAGVVFLPRGLIRTMHETIFHKQEKTVSYRETMYGIVEVLQNPSRRRLLQDDLDLGGTSMAYLSSQKPLGHLPMLLHPCPKKVFIIGFGVGGASYAVSTYPEPDKIDIAEINKSIAAAAPFFSDINHGVLSNPKCSLSINDGRHFLLTSRSRYEVISVDLLWPQTAGAGSLYTKEFYRLCFDHLGENGIMVEWVHPGLIPVGHVQIIIKTLRQVFPYAALWTSRDFGHLLLVGSKKAPLTVDYRLFARRIGRELTKQDLDEVGLGDPAVFMSYFCADGKDLDAFAENAARINTDDLPVIEFDLPLIRNWSWYGNALGLLSIRKSVLPLLQNVDSLERGRIVLHEKTMSLVLQSKIAYWQGDVRAVALCTEAMRSDPQHPEARAWYAELKFRMKSLSDSGKVPPDIISAFDTSAAAEN